MDFQRNHNVDNVNEAVALAEKLKSKGRYDLFRGQKMNWPLKSSFLRLNDIEQKEALKKLSRFEYWVENTKGLEPVANSADSCIAIAQHYGLPTNFIDFTTEPKIAGYFASEDDNIDGREKGCILCLNSGDLLGFWKALSPKYKAPEILYLQVDNLWRMEAQYGLFLYCPYKDIEKIYGLDRIYFPHSTAKITISSDKIYPNRKSQLEILLDQFFMNEQLIEGSRAIKNMAIHTIQIPNINEKFSSELCSSINSPQIHSSWDANKLNKWILKKRDNFFEVNSGKKREIIIDLALETNQIEKKIVNEFNNFLKEKDSRSFSINFQVVLVDKSTGNRIENRINKPLQRLWDGLRIHPYKNEDIAIGLTNCLMLIIHRIKMAKNQTFSWRDLTSKYFGKSIQVEFGSQDGSYSRSFVSQSGLLNAVREDIGEYLAIEWEVELSQSIHGLLQAIWSPGLLFDFNKLLVLFVREIVPIQILMRDDTSAIFFSPADLDAFGLP